MESSHHEHPQSSHNSNEIIEQEQENDFSGDEDQGNFSDETHNPHPHQQQRDDLSHVSQAHAKLGNALLNILEQQDTSVPKSPSKRAYTTRNPRKRKKKMTSFEDMDATRQSYIIKLFDRSIDLAQFDSNSSLYSMLRVWMRNEPFSDYSLRFDRTTSSQHLNCSDTSLPRQSNPEADFRIENGEIGIKALHSLPIPTAALASISTHSHVNQAQAAMARTEKLDVQQFDKLLDEDESADTADAIKSDHMARWKAVKQVSREQSFRAQALYKENISLLKSLFTPTNNNANR